MPAVRGETDKVAESLLGITGEGGIINRVENGLIPVEPKERADINGDAKEHSEGNSPTDRLASSAVQDEAYVLEAEQPTGARASGAIHSDIGEAFGRLIPPLHRVLVLTMRFTGPLPNAQGPENVQDAGTAEEDGMVAEQAIRGAAFANNILERSDKLLVGLHTIDIHDVGGLTAIDSSRGRTIINGRGIGVDDIREEVLVAPGNVESRIRGPVVSAKDVAHRNAGILGGALQSPLNHVRG
jgi:hypothetical protein